MQSPRYGNSPSDATKDGLGDHFPKLWVLSGNQDPIKLNVGRPTQRQNTDEGRRLSTIIEFVGLVHIEKSFDRTHLVDSIRIVNNMDALLNSHEHAIEIPVVHFRGPVRLDNLASDPYVLMALIYLGVDPIPIMSMNIAPG